MEDDKVVGFGIIGLVGELTERARSRSGRGVVREGVAQCSHTIP